MPERLRPSTDRTAVAPLAGLLVVALALRPQISAIGPLVPGIIAEFGVSHAFIGLLTAIPVLCMGSLAPIGPALAQRYGGRGAIALSVAIVVGAGVIRAIVPGTEALLVLTIALGIGTGLVGPILTMFVRARLPDRIVAGTAAYAGGTLLGATVGAAVAVPLATAFGGWRGSLLVESLVSIAAVGGWLVLVRSARSSRSAPAAVASGPSSGLADRPGSTRPAVPGDPVPRPMAGRRGLLPAMPLRRPVVWAIGLLFGLQSWIFYGTTAWLASVYIERGRSAADAALLVSIVSLTGLVLILLAPAATRLVSSRRALLALSAVVSTVGLVGIALAVEPAVLWTVVLGAGLGLTFTLVLTLPAEVSDDPREVGAAAAMTLLVGYLLAAAAPTALGIVRDATGSFGAVVWLLVAIAAAIVPLSLSLSGAHLRAGPRSPAGL
jgi:CP family cyanate transporter-like MFS transporter